MPGDGRVPGGERRRAMAVTPVGHQPGSASGGRPRRCSPCPRVLARHRGPRPIDVDGPPLRVHGIPEQAGGRATSAADRRPAVPGGRTLQLRRVSRNELLSGLGVLLQHRSERSARAPAASSRVQQAITPSAISPTMCARSAPAPTAAALASCARFFGMVDQGVRNRYVLLVTDGDPDCAGASSDACKDAQFQVSTLANPSNVTTIVVGLGPGERQLPHQAGAHGWWNLLPDAAERARRNPRRDHARNGSGGLSPRSQPNAERFFQRDRATERHADPAQYSDGWQPDGNSPRITLYGKACDTLLK